MRVGEACSPLSCETLLQRSGGGGDGVGAFGDAALERAGVHGEILREESRDGDAAGRVGAAIGGLAGAGSKASRGERLLGQKRAAGGERKEPQIGRCAGERGIAVVVRARKQPMRGALETFERIAQAHAHPAEARIVDPIDRIDRARDLIEIRPYRAALRKRQLAGDEVDRLDAVGALVDRGNARVAVMLRRAGLLDVAHAAVHLHAERGDLAADVGGERLGDRE